MDEEAASELLELMGKMAVRCSDSEEFVMLVAVFLEDQGLSPIEVCSFFLEFGRELGHADGHLCALGHNEKAQTEVGTGGYL